MMPTNTHDLELVPTTTLVQELMSRNTFLGILIYSLDEAKRDHEMHNFQAILSSALCDEDAKRLLSLAQDQVNALS